MLRAAAIAIIMVSFGCATKQVPASTVNSSVEVTPDLDEAKAIVDQKFILLQSIENQPNDGHKKSLTKHFLALPANPFDGLSDQELSELDSHIMTKLDTLSPEQLSAIDSYLLTELDALSPKQISVIDSYLIAIVDSLSADQLSAIDSMFDAL